jgi:hypothetical protein
LSLFRASGPDAPVPFSGDPPPKARRDVEELKQAIHFEREDASGVIQESFRLRRPVGWYYLQLSVILYRQQNDKTYAQLERFFFRKRPVEVLAAGQSIILPVSWPAIPIEELDHYGTMKPGGFGLY